MFLRVLAVLMMNDGIIIGFFALVLYCTKTFT